MSKKQGRPVANDWAGGPIPRPVPKRQRPNIYNPNFWAVGTGILAKHIIWDTSDPRHPNYKPPSK